MNAVGTIELCACRQDIALVDSVDDEQHCASLSRMNRLAP
jgi:hypothetical protein